MLIRNLLLEFFKVFWFHHHDKVIRQEVKLIDSLRFMNTQVKAQCFTEFKSSGVCGKANTAIKATRIRL